MSNWVEIGSINDIPQLGARVVESPQGNIAVFRNRHDEIFALLDKCPHKEGPLSQGIVHDKSVTCPLHNWVINLESGEAKGPDEGCTGVFPVKVESGTVLLNLGK